MTTPVDRTQLQIANAHSRFTWDDLTTFAADANQERRTEHRNLVHKEKLSVKFKKPDLVSKEVIPEVDGHFLLERELKKKLTDLGLIQATRVMAIDQPYVPAVAADAANQIAAVPAVLETYTDRDFFDINETFERQEIEAACRIQNRHGDVRYTTASWLIYQLVLINTSKELLHKVQVQIESTTEQARGGLLVLWLIRRAVVKASQDQADKLKDALKKHKLTDLKGENVDDAVRMW